MDDEVHAEVRAGLRARLARLYGAERAPAVLDKLLQRLQPGARSPRTQWDQRDVILITYGDSVTERGQLPLASLKKLLDERLRGLITTVHVLPFYPYSSDDGFAVVDYLQVNPMLGEWSDIEALGEHFDLMFDLVLNHISSRSRWFSQFLGDRPPGKDFFIDVDPTQDMSAVVRPRVQPVGAGFETERGFRYVWATFSDDQVDLNFENPDVLVEMVDIFQQYLLRGARAVRLDAVAFLWKTLGSSCVHLPQTHEVVKLMRDVQQLVAPGTLLLTETNVPHHENVSYFGEGDEAHMVYQFSLPPLLLHALYTGNASHLTAWARALQPAPEGCTFFNFTASHDGIGMRPAEGLLPPSEIAALAEGMAALGGMASCRTTPDGEQAVYELNITYFDAMGATVRGEDGLRVERFLCSQLLALSFQGIPALYVQSVFATDNDLAAVEHSGRLRCINRHKWVMDELETALGDPATPQARVLAALEHAVGVRRGEPAFHPDVPQQALDLGPAYFALRRGDDLWVLANMTDTPRTLTLPAECAGAAGLSDLLGDTTLSAGQRELPLAPYAVHWLRARQ